MRMAIAASILLATTLQAPAQQTQTREPAQGRMQQDMQRVSTQDFVNQAWMIDTFEIQAARAVESQVKDKQTRDFAKTLDRDHSRMNEELTSIAGKLSIKLPSSLDESNQQKLQQLKSASGQDLDRLFRTQQIQGHEKAIRLFQSYASDGDNAELKNWAKTAVATLQQHLDQAQALREPSGTM